MFREAWLPKGFEFLSGLPGVKRRRRRLVVFQAFVDDSGTKGTGKVLMLGGLFGKAEAFARLADDWEKELRAKIPLPIKYFKTDEAANLDGEFRHWRYARRDEKVRRLSALIDRQDFLMIYSAVDLQPHETMEHYVGAPAEDRKRHPYNQPYLMAALAIMMNVTAEARIRRLKEPVEQIFDQQLVFKEDVRFLYDVMCKNALDWMKDCLPSEPVFRDDLDFIVLQAADLLMGNARLYVERRLTKWPTIEWKHLKASGAAKIYDADELMSLTAGHLSRQTGIPREVLEQRFKKAIRRPSSGDGS